jgi:hypothetical protein
MKMSSTLHKPVTRINPVAHALRDPRNALRTKVRPSAKIYHRKPRGNNEQK